MKWLLTTGMLALAICLCAQVREINKVTLKSTYTEKEIPQSLRVSIDQAEKAAYFHDDFFNAMLKKILQDKRFSEKEKVQMFYLMQKKIGYAFTGVEYLPPGANYYAYHMGKLAVYVKTRATLKTLNYNVGGLLAVADSNRTKDVIVASNALLLAAILNPEKSTGYIEQFSKGESITKSANPAIFNHHVCMAASLKQNELIVSNLFSNLKNFTSCGMIEDLLCAVYSKANALVNLRDYVLAESNPSNELAVQTAVCVLASKLPEVAFKTTLEGFAKAAKEPWKQKLFKTVLAGKLPFNYTLTSKDQLVTKVWDGVEMTTYQDGTFVLNAGLMEFDPN